MGAQSNHPTQGQKRSLHFDVDASAPEALLDVAWAYLGPGSLQQGSPAPDGVFVRRRTPTPPPAVRTVPVEGLAPVDLTAPLPLIPRPAPPRLRHRADGVRVVARPPAMLPGVDHGPALRMDLHRVSEGIVFVGRRLELRELGDDVKGTVVTGVVPAAELSRFWVTVTEGLPPGRPVIVRLRTDEDAELLSLLRAIAPPGLRVVSYRLDESPVGTQRSSYLLPDVDVHRVAASGAVRVPVESLHATAEEEADARRAGQVHLTRRRVDRFLRRSLPTVSHNLSYGDTAHSRDIYVDGSVLRGTRTGGAAAYTQPGRWAAHAIPGATLPLEVELEALTLGHLMAAWSAAPQDHVTIHSDSRAALALLRDAHRERLTLGGARGERIRRALRRLLAAVDVATVAGVHVSTTWVKGHAGTRGNEISDELARSAARNTVAGVSAAELHERLDDLVRLWTIHPEAEEQPADTGT
ncbi:ribonuclease H family protein [Micrococcus sp.]|uniref:ribonuclease H family protein n=1 Tax=Micrococcus sp. TaxID=1271 RepID=UPI002A91F89A|nr:ribonuclease H family protein [Micrococcus sp.]MDY6054856.1 ribonuclease H family protein [Micrococcus sp.]